MILFVGILPYCFPRRNKNRIQRAADMKSFVGGIIAQKSNETRGRGLAGGGYFILGFQRKRVPFVLAG